MKFSLFKGVWDRWKNVGVKENVDDMMEYFKELERFLAGVFKNRISLRDNVFCDIIEENNISPNVNITLTEILKPNIEVEGVLVLQTSEPGDLVWSQSGNDLTYRFESTAPSIASLKLVIFYV